MRSSLEPLNVSLGTQPRQRSSRVTRSELDGGIAAEIVAAPGGIVAIRLPS